MPYDTKPVKNFAVPLLWMISGFMSWYLSIYLFSYVMSPVLIDLMRKTNTISQSIIIKNLANLLFAKIAGFSLCFILAALLGFFTQSTKLRLSLFIFGAIAVSLYGYIESLIGYVRVYSDLPSWAITTTFQGLISILLIIPLLSFTGSKVGRYFRLRLRGP